MLLIFPGPLVLSWYFSIQVALAKLNSMGGFPLDCLLWNIPEKETVEE